MLKIKITASKSEKEYVCIVENVYILLKNEKEGRGGSRREGGREACKEEALGFNCLNVSLTFLRRKSS